MRKGSQKLKDKEATELDWFLLGVFGKKIFGDHHEITRPNKKRKKVNGNYSLDISQ